MNIRVCDTFCQIGRCTKKIVGCFVIFSIACCQCVCVCVHVERIRRRKTLYSIFKSVYSLGHQNHKVPSAYTYTNKNSLHLYFSSPSLSRTHTRALAHGLIFFTLFIFPSNPRHRNKYSIIAWRIEPQRRRRRRKRRQRQQQRWKNAPREHTHSQTHRWEFLFGGFRRI